MGDEAGQGGERREEITNTTESTQSDSMTTDNSENLDEPGATMARICLKKDTSPVIRKEQVRLRMREKKEKEKPCNAASNISYDWKNRVLLRDGVVIDRFYLKIFQYNGQKRM